MSAPFSEPQPRKRSRVIAREIGMLRPAGLASPAASTQTYREGSCSSGSILCSPEVRSNGHHESTT